MKFIFDVDGNAYNVNFVREIFWEVDKDTNDIRVFARLMNGDLALLRIFSHREEWATKSAIDFIRNLVDRINAEETT